MAKNLPIVPTAKAGSLAETPGGAPQREQHPVIVDCSCLEVSLFCPDGALSSNNGKVKLDLRLCKGCGICATECKDGGIKMVPEYTGVQGVFPVKGGK
ncbi:MAG: 2-oxoacid:ferredoxin oxidoreductase subunit alpha [Desulfitobacterium hafniense]|nr:2-oxoacid:ferredoxin oxidoreductase subunit alpha [Desulfitobacterium hafniense]